MSGHRAYGKATAASGSDCTAALEGMRAAVQPVQFVRLERLVH